MKRFIIAVLVALCLGANASAQSNYTRQGNNFTQVSNKRTSGGQQTAKKTNMTYTTAAGDKYPIWLSAKGRAFIVRTSKRTGNEYKQYLGEDISRQVCRETGTKYVE